MRRLARLAFKLAAMASLLLAIAVATSWAMSPRYVSCIVVRHGTDIWHCEAGYTWVRLGVDHDLHGDAAWRPGFYISPKPRSLDAMYLRATLLGADVSYGQWWGLPRQSNWGWGN